MKLLDNLTMFSLAVKDMPKAKEFYVDKLGFKVLKDYMMDDNNWWVSVSLSNGPTITLTTNHENMKPGTMKLYFKSSDIVAAHKELIAKKLEVNDVKDDLYGPGSGVKWFNLNDPDGNQIFLAEQ